MGAYVSEKKKNFEKKILYSDYKKINKRGGGGVKISSGGVRKNSEINSRGGGVLF